MYKKKKCKGNKGKGKWARYCDGECCGVYDEDEVYVIPEEEDYPEEEEY